MHTAIIPFPTITVTAEDGRACTRPFYSHYYIPRPQIRQRHESEKSEPQAALKKRRTFTQSLRLKFGKDQSHRQATRYSEHMQLKMFAFPSNPSPSSPAPAKHTGLLPSLRTDSLWLSRPTQPLHPRKASAHPQTPKWLKTPTSPSSSSYVVSRSPILPIGGTSPSSPTTPRAVKYAIPPKPDRAVFRGATTAKTRRTSPKLGLETLMSTVQRDFKKGHRRSLSVSTTISVYSQASGVHSFKSGDKVTKTVTMTYEGGGDTFSIRSVETIQVPVSERTGAEGAIYFNVDPRLNGSTASTAPTLVETRALEPPPTTTTTTVQQTKSCLAGSRLSLQPCPSLASANRIMRRRATHDSDSDSDVDGPTPHDENSCRRYEEEPNPDSEKDDTPLPADDDLCADYDYIRAIDVLIYGARPEPDVPVDIVRRSSRAQQRDPQLVPVRRPTYDRQPPTGKRPGTASSATRHRRRGSAKVVSKSAWKANPTSVNNLKREVITQNVSHEVPICKKRRSVLFQVIHCFSKSS